MSFDIQQAPKKFDRWSGNSQGQGESLKYIQPSGEHGSQNLQVPIREEKLFSPGYAEPLCVSHTDTKMNIKGNNYLYFLLLGDLI